MVNQLSFKKLFVYILGLVLCCCGACSQGTSKNKTNAAAATGGVITTDFTFAPLSEAAAAYYKNAVETAYHKILGPAFNGAILVAKNGVVVYEDYKGYANFATKAPVTPTTPFHLASVSKTFTGTTVLRLWEQGRLSLDDSVQRFIPQLPYHGITIRMLLSHRSGLPNYLYFMDSCWNKKVKASNEDVLQFMVQHKPRVDNLPNKAFHYCNTNFVMLAMIVEKITGMPFPQYMKDSVFTPLGMTHSFIFSMKDTSQYVPTYMGNRPYPMDHLDCTYGDKNVYSTVQDLLLWDKALYMHTFVKAATLDTAYKPNSLEHRSMHNYGLGWRLFINNGDTIVYHNGKWHGTNTVFTRLVQDTATIIVLGNRFNRNIYKAKGIADVFTGKTDNNKLEE
ncbi:serine hydrolase domain-containing protein [Deminuibacter soli]|uniref:Class A beta-lactamase-related serine hydrolase n=1 Tax=Deminuibacter soli TaxID=2291815 RepID=A0A3E1NKH4_9BACT|nr:serine hydrolase domain-containing protein [Deminuibacter soli]RFM28334.1 class A beta-lactamase-related serine hydrolase [Deminuibacter soli]